MARLRRRFVIKADEGGWLVVDRRHGSCLPWSTRAQAQTYAAFCRVLARSGLEVDLTAAPMPAAYELFDTAGGIRARAAEGAAQRGS